LEKKVLSLFIHLLIKIMEMASLRKEIPGHCQKISISGFKKNEKYFLFKYFAFFNPKALERGWRLKSRRTDKFLFYLFLFYNSNKKSFIKKRRKNKRYQEKDDKITKRLVKRIKQSMKKKNGSCRFLSFFSLDHKSRKLLNVRFFFFFFSFTVFFFIIH
jgi:hypothetical protein